jgi:hypothetical protein
MRGGHLLAPNIFQQSCGCWIQQLWTNKCADYRYNFKDLRRFPALQGLVVLIKKTHLEDKEQKRKIEEKINRVIEASRKSFPCINVPEVEFRVCPTQHTCQAHGPPWLVAT